MTNRHKVFVSYYHAEDQNYKEQFERICANVMVSKSVNDGDIDPNLPAERIWQIIRDEYLQDSTVTVVLIGNHTWQRKHVDWEIYSSIRNSKVNQRSGMIGILLPTYTRPSPGHYYNHTIPPRLYDNLQTGFVDIYGWSNDPSVIERRIHEAFLKRDKEKVDLSRDIFRKNRSGDEWQ